MIILDASASRIKDAAPSKYIWKLINSDKTFMSVEGGSKVVFATGTPGQYRFLLIGVSVDGTSVVPTPIVLDKEVTVTVESSDPKPPGPGPKPPGPGPSEKLTVVVIKDFKQVIPQEQQNIFSGEKTTAYLQATCPITSTDTGFRFLDAGSPTAGQATFIQKALAQPRDSLPWVVIQGPKSSYSGPLPENEEKFIALVEQYK